MISVFRIRKNDRQIIPTTDLTPLCQEMDGHILRGFSMRVTSLIEVK